MGLAMGVRILTYTMPYHALLSLRKDPVQIQHVEDNFLLRYSEILIPVKRIKIMMLTSISLEKYINKKSSK
jgi:hypothetical protein